MPNTEQNCVATAYDIEAARVAFPIRTISVTPAGEGHKVLSFGIPSYNAAKDMDHCITSILEGSKFASDIEIIIVDDGSEDETGAKADEWEARYPGIVRVVHQENGGHGMAVRAGLREAQGTYYKVVDSDDWLDAAALSTMLTILRGFEERNLRVDLFISNYVYEKVHEGTHTTISYRMALPRKKVFSWEEIGRFRPIRTCSCTLCATARMSCAGTTCPCHRTPSTWTISTRTCRCPTARLSITPTSTCIVTSLVVRVRA